jgi:hypothetical protein
MYLKMRCFLVVIAPLSPICAPVALVSVSSVRWGQHVFCSAVGAGQIPRVVFGLGPQGATPTWVGELATIFIQVVVVVRIAVIHIVVPILPVIHAVFRSHLSSPLWVRFA